MNQISSGKPERSWWLARVTRSGRWRLQISSAYRFDLLETGHTEGSPECIGSDALSIMSSALGAISLSNVRVLEADSVEDALRSEAVLRQINVTDSKVELRANKVGVQRKCALVVLYSFV